MPVIVDAQAEIEDINRRLAKLRVKVSQHFRRVQAYRLILASDVGDHGRLTTAMETRLRTISDLTREIEQLVWLRGVLRVGERRAA